MTTNIKLIRQSKPVADLANQQIGVEDAPDADLGFTMWGGKDAAGNTQKFLAKDEAARVESLGVNNLTAGLVETDADGVMSTADSLADLNAALGTTIDESGDARTPSAHALIDNTGHTVSGLTPGHVLTALTATTVVMTAPAVPDLQAVLDVGSDATPLNAVILDGSIAGTPAETTTAEVFHVTASNDATESYFKLDAYYEVSEV